MAWLCPWQQGGKQVGWHSSSVLEKYSTGHARCAALPGCSPKATRTSQDRWEQAPGGIRLGTEAKQDPQL